MSGSRQAGINGIDGGARRQLEAKYDPASELPELLPTSVPESSSGATVDVKLHRRARGMAAYADVMNTAWRAPNTVRGDLDTRPAI